MGIEFHLPGTKLAKKRKRGYPRINQLDKIAKKQDIDYCLPKNLTAYWKADTKTKRKKTSGTHGSITIKNKDEFIVFCSCHRGHEGLGGCHP